MAPDRPNKIYSATYSNVPVYECNVGGNHIMRRRSDDWINATHILKVADHDKPARTRILEREVQKGVHEKIQGGYGKYQGTWIPLADGRLLAQKNGVLEKLLPIFDFVPGDRSPPPAPKHATATVSKPRAPRQSAESKKQQASSQQQSQQQKQQQQQQPQKQQQQQQQQPQKQVQQQKQQQPQHHQHHHQQQQQQQQSSQQSQNQNSDRLHEAYSVHETPDLASVDSESDADVMSRQSQFSGYNSGRKRKRNLPEEPEAMPYEEQQHLLWTDELLDYFMLQNSNDPLPAPPDPPQTIDLNRAVDDKGHTPMHWAAAMGDLAVVRDLVHRNARTDTAAFNGESPLMRAVLFTNNFDKQTMDRLVQILHPTVHQKDYCDSTALHHIAATTCSKTKYQCAKYYLDTILEQMSTNFTTQQIADLLDQRDQNGDTAILIAARFGARKCVRTLMQYGANPSIPNNKGQAADELIEQLNARRRERHGLSSLNFASSSPVQNGLAHLSAATNLHRQNDSTASNIFGRQTTNNDANLLPSSATATPHSLKHATIGAKRQKLATYRSEAAQLLTSQLPVLISSRTEALAGALEAELRKREKEVDEGERVLESRRRDLADLKAQLEKAKHESLFNTGHTEADMTEVEELRLLEDEARQLLRQEQMQEIARFMKRKGSHDSFVSADDSGVALLTNGVSGHGSPSGKDASLNETTSETREVEHEVKFRIAQQVIEKQAEQAELLEAIVSAQASEIDGGHPSNKERDREKLYKRLITAALPVSISDVEAMLPDILRELENAKREREQGALYALNNASSATASALVAGSDFGYNARNTHHHHDGHRPMSENVRRTDVDGARDAVGVAG